MKITRYLTTGIFKKHKITKMAKEAVSLIKLARQPLLIANIRKIPKRTTYFLVVLKWLIKLKN